MEKNGRNLCTGNSRHIDIRYFFTKDRVDKGELDIGYCPTEKMLADFFTKPLQGSLFKVFRAVIMGHEPIDSLLQDHRIKECVGDRVIRSNLQSLKENRNVKDDEARDDNVAQRGERRNGDAGARTYKDVLVSGMKERDREGVRAA